MSNIKISELEQAGALTGEELVPIVQDGITVRTTLQQVQNSNAIEVSNDIEADASSTTKVPSVNAIKTYTDGIVMGLVDDRGNFTPSPSLPGGFPTLNGSGAGGQIMKGDLYFIDDAGYINGVAVTAGQSIRALADNPLQDPTKWNILSAGLIQSTLQNVLDAGRIANGANATITLNNTSTYKLELLPQNATVYLDNGTESYYNTISGANSELKNITKDNSIYQYVGGNNSYIKVSLGFTGNYSQLFSDQIYFYKNSYLNKFKIDTITSAQTWTLPNASGTIALANNVWNATGNAGTVAGANFLGTTDAVDLVLKTNNLERIRVANTGGVIISNLAGTGTRTVVASPTGQLSTTISSSGWSTLGNASTSPLTNFIGTTDDVDLVFKTNNVEQLRLKSTGGSGNIETPFDIYAQNNMGGSTIIAKDSAAINGFASISWDTTNKGILSLGNGTVKGTIKVSNLTSTDKTYQLPNASGTLALNENTWGLTGNAGTTAGTNFIGTTDNKDLVFKVNNIERLRIDSIYGEVKTTGQFRAEGSGDTTIMAFSTVGNGGVYIAQDSVTKGYMFMSNGTGNSQIQCNNVTTTGNILQLPNASGTIALTTTVTLQNVLAGTNKNLTNGVNLQGTGAGVGNIGINVNAFGNGAAQTNVSNDINAFGNEAASLNQGINVNALGANAAKYNSGSNVNIFGSDAGVSNDGIDVNAMGFEAAYANNGNYVNAFGNQAAKSNQGNNVNAFGTAAGNGNTINGATIFSNDSLPTYVNHAAAAAAITTGAGGTTGCTYLYHNQATNSIGAVRL